MEDVLDVYERPYDPARPIICFDETRKELHGSPCPDTPALPGSPLRQDYEYKKNGSASLLFLLNPSKEHAG